MKHLLLLNDYNIIELSGIQINGFVVCEPDLMDWILLFATCLGAAERILRANATVCTETACWFRLSAIPLNPHAHIKFSHIFLFLFLFFFHGQSTNVVTVVKHCSTEAH